MLVIHCNDNHKTDRAYIYDVVFRDFWHMDYQIQYELRKDIALEMDGQILYMADTFFQQDESAWLQEKSLPKQPLQKVTLSGVYTDCATDANLPIVFGDVNITSLFNEKEKYSSLDIFGSAFFMLTRYEETVKKERDQYDRFPAPLSLAYQEDFLERPIVNEYLEILWRWLKKAWPRMERKERSFKIMPTHDMDSPLWTLGLSTYVKYRVLMGDIVKRRDWSMMMRHRRIFREADAGRYENDPNNTFGRIMDISEKRGMASTFYAMTSHGRHELDGQYDVLSIPIRNLIRDILGRGHNLGVHPGAGSYIRREFVQVDADMLRELIAKENLNINAFGGRQHYLQWKAPETWGYYEAAGLLYDTTLSYADHIGFRCGICYDYPTYNAVTHERYKLREYPLEVMECSGLDYMGLSHEEMRESCCALKHKVKKYGGTFVILWHNTRFIEEEEAALYEQILDG